MVKDALARCRRREHWFGGWLPPSAGALIVGKEEQPVLLKRPADRCAKNIAIELQRLVRQPYILFRLLDQVIIGAGDCIPHVFIQRTVKRVGPALGHERDLCAGTLALVSPIIRRGYA